MKKESPVIFVLNLDTSPERLSAIREKAEQYGLKINRIAGVNCNELTQEEIAAVYSPRLNQRYYRHALTPGEIGCYLGHKKIWQKIIAENINYAVILEDDALLEANFPQALEAAGNIDNIELVKLAYTKIEPAQTRPISEAFTLVNYRRIPNCAIGYILTPRGAEKLMRRKMIYRPVDVDIQFTREINLNVLGLMPYSITHNHAFDSDIVKVNGGTHFNQSTAWRNIRYRLAIWWNRQIHYSGKLL